MKKVSIYIFFTYFSIYVCAMHVFVVYIILCNKNWGGGGGGGGGGKYINVYPLHEKAKIYIYINIH